MHGETYGSPIFATVPSAFGAPSFRKKFIETTFNDDAWIWRLFVWDWATMLRGLYFHRCWDRVHAMRGWMLDLVLLEICKGVKSVLYPRETVSTWKFH